MKLVPLPPLGFGGLNYSQFWEMQLLIKGDEKFAGLSVTVTIQLALDSDVLKGNGWSTFRINGLELTSGQTLFCRAHLFQFLSLESVSSSFSPSSFLFPFLHLFYLFQFSYTWHCLFIAIFLIPYTRLISLRWRCILVLFTLVVIIARLMN